VYLREKFRHLDMGIVGVNIAVAETGTIINVENEGNIRMTKSSPRTLVAVMSLEKVVPTMADAVHMVRILCRNCTGQKISSYVSMDTGPKKPWEIDGPEELFIVIVDNGRSEIYQDLKTREVLKCIRCGAEVNKREIFLGNAEGIDDETIVCPKCLRWYPIRDEIPEMLPDELRKENEDLPFMKKWKAQIPENILYAGNPFRLKR
jgi:uncharacterized protein YbaR (Trm112 family)